jgi:hypothetical protein
MNFGTSRRDVIFVVRGVKATEGLGTRAGETGMGRGATVVDEAEGTDEVEVATVEGPAVGEVVNAEGVDGSDADALDGSNVCAVARAFTPPLVPAQPATTIESTEAPARERAEYQRACLTTTHASEQIHAERSTFDMMAW